MTLMEMLVKWSVTLTDRLGPEILTVLEIKAQVLHRVRLHVKVPGWLLNLNALLTKKLSMFLSRLNEMSGGRENICFGVISKNCEVFKNDIFDCKLLWMVGNVRVNGIMSVSSFSAVCSAVSRSISWARCLPVVTAESG